MVKLLTVNLREQIKHLVLLVREGKQRLFELATSERKFSAQLQEIKSPLREQLLRELKK